MAAEKIQQIFVTMSNAITSDAYALAIEGGYTNLTVQTCDTVEELRTAIQKAPACCVILDCGFAGPSLNEILKDRAESTQKSIFLLVGCDEKLRPPERGSDGIFYLPARPTVNELTIGVETALELSHGDPKFCKVSIQTLRIRGVSMPCDVYLKLSDEKFVKVLHEGAKFGKDEFERFFQKKTLYLYFPRDAFLLFMESILSEAKALELDSNASIGNIAVAMNSIFDAMHSLFEVDGFTSQAQMMASVSVNLAINTMKRNPKLSELLEKMDANRESYLNWHSVALSFLSCKLATALDWKSESSFYKLSLASMLHDISLPDDDLVRRHDGCIPGAPEPTPEELEVIKGHPTAIASLVSEMSDVPGEVAFILEQHHENANGTGYPRGANHKDISPISALFIITHDLVTEYYRSPVGIFDMTGYLQRCEAEKRFTKGAFGHVFRGIMSKLKELG